MAKTKTSTEVKNNWNAKTYKRYTLSLRYDDDMDLIKYIDSQTDSDGKGVSDLIKTALREKKKRD